MEKQRFCMHCGSPLLAEATFCTSCGARLDDKESQGTSEPTQPSAEALANHEEMGEFIEITKDEQTGDEEQAGTEIQPETDSEDTVSESPNTDEETDKTEEPSSEPSTDVSEDQPDGAASQITADEIHVTAKEVHVTADEIHVATDSESLNASLDSHNEANTESELSAEMPSEMRAFVESEEYAETVELTEAEDIQGFNETFPPAAASTTAPTSGPFDAPVVSYANQQTTIIPPANPMPTNANQAYASPAPGYVPPAPQQFAQPSPQAQQAFNPGYTQQMPAVPQAAPAPQQQSYAAVYTAPAEQEKSSTGSKVLIVVAIALVAILAALIAFLQPWTWFYPANTPTQSDVIENIQEQPAPNGTGQTAEEARKAEEAKKAEEAAKAEAANKEHELYLKMKSAKKTIGSYSDKIAKAATAFNNNYLNTSKRSSLSQSAHALEDKINDSAQAFRKLDVPTTSKYYQNWDDLCTCYDYLEKRISVITEAWEIDLSYYDPSFYKDAITAPFARDRGANGSNKYYEAYNKLYPKIKIKE